MEPKRVLAHMSDLSLPSERKRSSKRKSSSVSITYSLYKVVHNVIINAKA